MVLDPTSNKFYESQQKLADFPYELKRKISELCEQKLPQAGFKDNQIEDVKSALAIRIYSDKSPFKLTSSLLDKVNRLPFDEENPPRIFLPKDLFLHAQNADFETTKHYIENNLACGYARQGKAKIFKYDELNRDTKFFGIPRGNNEMEDGEPGLLLKTIKDLYTFSPLVAFWEAEKLLNPDDEIADKFKELIDKDKRKNYSDPYFNFPLDLSGVVLVFIITDMNKFPNVFKNKLETLHVPPDLIQSTIRHANFPQQNASNSHASASTSANSSLASPPIDPATATFPNIILGASQSRHMTGITRQALGRKASIGDFYDARSDTIIENTLPFPENLLAVSYHSFDNKSLNEMWGDSFEEKFRHLQVEDELQASYHARYLLGFDVDGHANFIFRRQKKQEIFYTLIYRHRTQTKHLNYEKSKEFIANNYKELPADATHIITDIDYGGVATFTVGGMLADGVDKSELKEKLCEAINSLKGDNWSCDFDENLTIYLDHDFSNDIHDFSKQYNQALHDTFNDLSIVREFYRNFNFKIRTINNGVGVPIAFHMQPLEMLQMEQEFPKAFHVPPSEIKRITDMLEDLEKSKIEVDTINRLFDEYAYCISGPKEDPLSMDSRKLLTDISTDLDLFAGDRIEALQDYLLKIRNENSSNSIVDCYASREEHRSKVIEKLQSPKIRLDTEKINYIKRLKGSGVIYLKKGQKLDKEIETLKCRHCYIFFGRFSLPGKETKFDERRKNFDKLIQQNPTAFFVDLQMHKDLKEIFAKQNFYNLPSASQIGNQIWRYCINSNGKPELKNVDTNESRQSKVTNHSENNSNANCRIM